MLERAAELCTDKSVVENLKTVMERSRTLAQGAYSVVYDKSLVRGMGYYTGMVFEIASDKFKMCIRDRCWRRSFPNLRAA